MAKCHCYERSMKHSPLLHQGSCVAQLRSHEIPSLAMTFWLRLHNANFDNQCSIQLYKPVEGSGFS